MATDVHLYASRVRHGRFRGHSHSHPHPPPPKLVDDVNLFSKYSAMSTSEHPVAPVAATYPRHHKLPWPKRTLDRLRTAYYRYEVTYGLYVMSPGEKLALNTFALVCLSLLTWALFWYFPPLLYQKAGRLGWILTGKDGPETMENVTIRLASSGVSSAAAASAKPHSWMDGPPLWI